MPDSLTQQATPPNAVRASNGVRAPSGLPIFSIEPLTGAERQKLLDLQEQYRLAVLQIELCLRIGRVDTALETLQFLSRDVDGTPAAIALTLGSGR